MKINTLCVFVLLFTFQNLSSQNSDSEVVFYCPPCNSQCDDIKFEKAGKCTHCGMTLQSQTAAQRENTLKLSEMTIGFYLQDGVEVLDFAGPMEVFSYAGFNVITISMTKDPITSQGILTIIPDYSIEDAPKLDILATFGGNSSRAFDDIALVKWVENQDVDYHFSVCTGAFLFGKAGILKGLQATTFHSAIDALQEQNPDTKVHSDVRYVDNGTVITTAGISAGIDGALHLVHKLFGLDAAKAIATNMEYDKWIPEEGLIVDIRP